MVRWVQHETGMTEVDAYRHAGQPFFVENCAYSGAIREVDSRVFETARAR